MSAPRLARTAAALARMHAGKPVVLVPTMGALHAGHMRLVAKAHAHARRQRDMRVCVSIFVNPLQFGPREDYGRYPRQLRQDLRMLAGWADSCYAPSGGSLYPEPQEVLVQPPPLGDELCGASRPGFFQGVLTVVTKLLAQIRPAAVVFGEKDYQQLVLVKQMIRQLNFGCKVLAAPIVREADGLALSSRNAYLNTPQRTLAPAFNQALRQARADMLGGMPPKRACSLARQRLTRLGFEVDYLECRGLALGPPEHGAGFVILGAVLLGSTRLIDNCISRTKALP